MTYHHDLEEQMVVVQNARAVGSSLVELHQQIDELNVKFNILLVVICIGFLFEIARVIVS